MNISEIRYFAKISQLTYSDPSKLVTASFKQLGCKIEKFYDKKGAQAYLLKAADHYVLSFRGTEVTEPSDIKADLYAGKNNAQAGGKIHVGFKKELSKIWTEIRDDLVKIKKTPVYLTGHSLGAGMATIAASRLAPSKITALVTFGSPKVGTQEFVDACTFTHYRVQNNRDIVTRVPPRAMGFIHQGINVWMDYDGIITTKSTMSLLIGYVKGFMAGNKFVGLSDHKMENYLAKLDKLPSEYEV